MVSTKDEEQVYSYEAFERFFASVNEESDRSAVIIVVSRIDNLLGDIIRNALIPNASEKDDLLDGDNPLSTFSARINLSYRLGLIDAEFASILRTLKKLRNDFAHQEHAKTLAEAPSIDRAREIISKYVQEDGFQDWVDFVYPSTSARTLTAHFRAAICLLAVRLEGIRREQIGLFFSSPWTIKPPHWQEVPNKTQTPHQKYAPKTPSTALRSSTSPSEKSPSPSNS